MAISSPSNFGNPEGKRHKKVSGGELPGNLLPWGSSSSTPSPSLVRCFLLSLLTSPTHFGGHRTGIAR